MRRYEYHNYPIIQGVTQKKHPFKSTHSRSKKKDFSIKKEIFETSNYQKSPFPLV